uniref:Tetratricopeptide repeat protein 39B n=1 Tax=Salmo trutta TaxID=8032 RepID=A0A673VZD2_SALTR
MDLETALQDSAKALDLFLNNRFSDALDLLRPWSQSMYHAVGYSSMLVMQAGMTFEPNDVEKATTALKESLQTCQMFRKKTTMVEAITEMFYKQPADDLTEEEMHAELCYAEALLQKGALTFLDESMISFIKGGIKIRDSFLIYKGIFVLWSSDAEVTIFTVLVFLFQYLSLLPSKVLRLLEWMGFSGDREVGLSQLREGAASNSLRSILSTLCLLMYHLYISVILGPKTCGALILFYQARIAVLKGNFEFAQKKFLECIAAQQEWRQIHHLCYWELMWSYSFQQDWLEAYQYADLLCKESKWSQAVYVFQKASILSMMPEEEVKRTGENVEQLFRQVESLRLRIAGKSIPTEKFAAKKAQRYSAATPVTLLIPAVEMIYVWNGFTIVGKRPELTESILVTIKKAEEQLKNPSEYHVDDQCMVQMLKGLCLRHLGRLDQAQLCFTRVISSENGIKHDRYLVPYSMYELGLLYKQQGDLGKATTTIKNAKLNYKGYSMESRLHFRIHAALNTMGTSVAKLPPHRTSA